MYKTTRILHIIFRQEIFNVSRFYPLIILDISTSSSTQAVRIVAFIIKMYTTIFRVNI